MKANAAQREDAPLLAVSDDEETEEEAVQQLGLSNWQLAGLYGTHSLSMWNSRSNEFAAVLWTAAAYPHTLSVASLRGLSANLSSLLLSPVVGRWCNQYPSRLRTLQVCIVMQRICIGLAALAWMTIVSPDDAGHERNGSEGREDVERLWRKHAVMGVIIVLGMIEKLSWVGNIIVMERDWVPLLADDTTKPALHILNANVKRIDLISKFVAPLAVNGVLLGIKRLKLLAILVAVMQVVTVVPELATATKVWKSAPALQIAKKVEEEPNSMEGPTISKQLATWLAMIRRYVTSPVFLPSLTFVIQPLSVLTLAASMMMYLLSANFPVEQVTLGRTLSTGLEITATIITPLLISWFRRRSRHPPEDGRHFFQPLIKMGLIGLSWQICTLVPAVFSLLILPDLPDDPTKSFPVLTKVLLISLGLSRMGPFAYALVEQQLVQIAVPKESRVEFSGTEFALFSFAELCRWSLTGIFGHPNQFKGVAVLSFVAVVIAAMLFWKWTRNWRARLKIEEIEDPVNDS